MWSAQISLGFAGIDENKGWAPVYRYLTGTLLFIIYNIFYFITIWAMSIAAPYGRAKNAQNPRLFLLYGSCLHYLVIMCC